MTFSKVELTPPANQWGPVDIHDAVDHVRQNPAFQESPLTSFLKQLSPEFYQALQHGLTHVQQAMQHFFDRAGHMIQNLFPGMPTQTANALSQTFRVSIVILSILIGVAVFYVLLTLIKQWMDRQEKASSPKIPEIEDISLRSEEYMGLAGRSAESGDYGQAIRFVYLALLVVLNETQTILFSENRTHGEYIRCFEPMSQTQSIFRGVGSLFEKVKYGRYQPRLVDYEMSLHEYQRFLACLSPTDKPQEADDDPDSPPMMKPPPWRGMGGEIAKTRENKLP